MEFLKKREIYSRPLSHMKKHKRFVYHKRFLLHSCSFWGEVTYANIRVQREKYTNCTNIFLDYCAVCVSC